MRTGKIYALVVLRVSDWRAVGAAQENRSYRNSTRPVISGSIQNELKQGIEAKSLDRTDAALVHRWLN